MASPILKHFEYEHLTEDLHDVVAPIVFLAEKLDLLVPDGPEKSAGLRKLLEAMDCMIRAATNN
jgi:hypothetical protein